MTAEVDTRAEVYHCAVCGPILRFCCLSEEAEGELHYRPTITLHKLLPHPAGVSQFDNDDGVARQ